MPVNETMPTQLTQPSRLLLTIQNGDTVYCPVVQSGITWETQRKGTPGKLAFTVVPDGGRSFGLADLYGLNLKEELPQTQVFLNVQEGNLVWFYVDDQPVFRGFVFSKQRDSGGAISIVAYDQIRYLKNKDNVSYENLTATQVLQMLAKSFHLTCGDMEDTKHVIEVGLEQDSTLIDILQNALDDTLQVTGRLYVLYDNCGALTLKDVEHMKLDLLIDRQTGENFDYTSSIDEQTYNQVKLACENKKTGKLDTFVEKDSSTIAQWGLLQYYEKVDNPDTAVQKVQALLKLNNHKSRKLTIQKALGDVRVRAGSSVGVALDLGDLATQNYMLVERATHTFTDQQEYFMDLTLIGGEFFA